MIVADEITINDEFDNENVKMSDNVKLYIDDLIKKRIEKKSN